LDTNIDSRASPEIAFYCRAGFGQILSAHAAENRVNHDDEPVLPDDWHLDADHGWPHSLNFTEQDHE
jgi:hypothetical protein